MREFPLPKPLDALLVGLRGDRTGDVGLLPLPLVRVWPERGAGEGEGSRDVWTGERRGERPENSLLCDCEVDDSRDLEKESSGKSDWPGREAGR